MPSKPPAPASPLADPAKRNVLIAGAVLLGIVILWAYPALLWLIGGGGVVYYLATRQPKQEPIDTSPTISQMVSHKTLPDRSIRRGVSYPAPHPKNYGNAVRRYKLDTRMWAVKEIQSGTMMQAILDELERKFKAVGWGTKIDPEFMGVNTCISEEVFFFWLDRVNYVKELLEADEVIKASHFLNRAHWDNGNAGQMKDKVLRLTDLMRDYAEDKKQHKPKPKTQ